MGQWSVRRCSVLVAAVSFIMLTGCKAVTGQSDVTGSTRSASQETYRKLAETWGKRYQSNPGDKTASLNYARALRGIDEKPQAVSVLQQALARHPDDPEILAAYGKLLVETGQLELARAVLSRAHTPDMPNARVLSAQGVVADQSGEHAKAQELYRSALKQDPNDPVILTNLGLSLLLSRQSREAETVLRRAVASPRADLRMRETFALALVVNGRTDEAVSVLGVDMAAAAAREKVAELQQGAASEGLSGAVRAAQKAEAPLKLAPAKEPAPVLKRAHMPTQPPIVVTEPAPRPSDNAPLALRSGIPPS